LTGYDVILWCLCLSSMSYRIQANSYQMRPNSWKFDRHIRSSTLRSHWYTLMRVVEFWGLIFFIINGCIPSLQ
jgi:hypothetical protein